MEMKGKFTNKQSDFMGFDEVSAMAMAHGYEILKYLWSDGSLSFSSTGRLISECFSLIPLVGLLEALVLISNATSPYQSYTVHYTINM